MSIHDPVIPGGQGVAFQTRSRVIIVQDGRRGPRGYKGDKGDQGDPGPAYSLSGPWEPNVTYCPLDSVTWRSSAVSGVNSLYIQRSAVPCLLSTIPPHLDATRWEEVGAVSISNAFGGIWEVFQIGHGFTRVGQPVGYSMTANRYVLANARRTDELAIAVVREVVSDDVVVLQSTGEIPAIDPAIIWPPNSSWDQGAVYYVSTILGRVSLTPPSDPNFFVNPILIPTDLTGGVRNGVALPWAPGAGPGTASRQLVGFTKFYFQEGSPTAILTGPDRDGHVLSYIPGQVEVFVGGLNLVEGDDYTATNGESITLVDPLPPGVVAEIWTPDGLPVPVLASTSLKVDNIENLFNGTLREFPLTYLGDPIPPQNAVNMRVWIDVNPQEPLVDFDIVVGDTPESSLLSFAEAPEAGARFWAILMEAAANAEPIELRNNGVALQWKYVSAPDEDWVDVIQLDEISYQINAFGAAADRDDYDAEGVGFTFMDVDAGIIWVRYGASGNWVGPFPFYGVPGPPIPVVEIFSPDQATDPGTFYFIPWAPEP